MADKKEKASKWKPFTPLNLALAIASEAGIAAANDALGIPQGAGAISSAVASASIEVVKNHFKEARHILTSAAAHDSPLPKQVTDELTEDAIEHVVSLLDKREAQLMAAAYKGAIRNVGGMHTGISLVYLA